MVNRFIFIVIKYFFFICFYKGYKVSFNEYVGYFLDSEKIFKKYYIIKLDIHNDNLSDIKSIYLEVENNSIKKMLENVPHSIYKKIL